MKYSIALSENTNERLLKHLIRKDGQEDLCFAFYNLSTGVERLTGCIKEIILPEEGDRNIHKNVSFNSEFFDKVTSIALAKGYGIIFIHSHLTLGLQKMSSDDIKAEKMLAPRVKAVTRLPLIGMTCGTDGIWSARFWVKIKPRKYKKIWCESVRIMGKGFNIIFNNYIFPKPLLETEFERTISSWGAEKQAIFARLKVGVIGCGSVGSIIGESLYRTGIRNLNLIDFDLLEIKNLDRSLSASRNDIGMFKSEVIQYRLKSYDLFNKSDIKSIPYSITEKEGLMYALDCDILFSCVDRPLPRYILDCLSYSNLIPVIDGGIDTNPNKTNSNIDQARWKAHTCGPERRCMSCIEQYTPENVALEQSGLLEDPKYIRELPKDHFINKGQNVFAFSLGLAGMEMQQFLSLFLQPRGQFYGPKEFDFNSGNIDQDFDFNCNQNCSISSKFANADITNILLLSRNKIAEKNRELLNHLL